MKDFFDRQEAARKRTSYLFFLFVFAVVLIVVGVYMAISSLSLLSFEYYSDPDSISQFWKLSRFLFVSFCVLTVILSGSLYKIWELKGGGYRLAEMLGGKRIYPATDTPDERRLLNVVEEMAIASGIPVPAVYVMEKEGGINAFAAGYGIDDAVISVTKGSIALLSREELQGVIAHEFSHIFNGDTSINIRLLGWLHGILLISLIGEGVLRKTGRVRVRGSIPVAGAALALYIIGYIGVFIGKLIKSAVSRQREYLADASAVQFTRNPSGLAGALKKIGGLTSGSLISHPQVSEASHMYFGNGVGESWFSIMTTHPPLLDRILQLEPSFDGRYTKIEALRMPVQKPYQPDKPAPKPADHISKVMTGAAAMAILSTIGAPMKEHAEISRELISRLPESLRDAIRDPFGSCALIYALLLDQDTVIRKKQLLILRDSGPVDIVSEVEKLAKHSNQLTRRGRLPLLDMAIPSLRALSPDQYAIFKANVNSLADADEKLSLFESILRYILFRHLDACFLKPKKKVAQIYSTRGVAWECSCVLSVLARSGHEGDEEAEKAFVNGYRVLSEPRLEMGLLSLEECTPENLGKALDRLDVTSPLVKRKLLAACLECLTFDKTIKAEEAELFRAIAEGLGCPVPPWLSLQDKEDQTTK
jgi:Zn-dependent protease with chaperone function